MLLGLILLLVLLNLSLVIAAPSIETNTTTAVGTETFTINTATNETSLIMYSYSSGGSEIARANVTTNSSSNSIVITGLDGNTDYTWQVNYTSLSATTTIYNEVTTDQYILIGVVRLLLNLFGIVLTSVFLVGIFAKEGFNKDTGKVLIVAVILLIAFLAIVNGILAS